MTVKVKFERGEIVFNLVDVLEYVDKEQLDDLVQALACHDRIVEQVAAQIVDGMTDNGSWGGSCGTNAAPVTPLDKASRRVALAGPEITAKEVRDLQEALARAETRANEWQEKYFELRDKERRRA